MKRCFGGHKRGCIYHSHKSPIICVIPFCVLPLLEDAREIQQPIPQGDCPRRDSHEKRGRTGGMCSLPVVRSKRIVCFNHCSQLP